MGFGKDTYRGWLLNRDEATCSVEQHVGPPTFLVNDPSRVTVIIVPWCARLLGESLDTPKRRVLRGGGNNIGYEV